MSRITDQLGRVLDERYRLIAPIGTGASAQVYLADDVRLRRRVAVKVLHAALATDDAFLRRFRAEAQAAAALNHPHLLAVYDWGHDELPYLVTEYLAGGSLRSMLDQEVRLSPSQALLVGLQAARALDYAHQRGFVHRDIKPANLLFGEDGRLRIADFGLARALAEAAWTEPSGVLVGTARYASPEQALGQRADAASDIYSLAVVLVEAVTGEVPFAADTPIATLMARVDRQMPIPEELGPLGRVLERAGRPHPEDRPDAGRLVTGLMAAAEDLPRPEPLPLAGPHVVTDETVVLDADPTMLPPTTQTAVDDPAVVEEPPEVLERTGRRRWPWIVLAVLLALGIGGASAYAVVQARVPTHPVPELVGHQVGDVSRLIGPYGWRVSQVQDRKDGTQPGDIIGQRPKAGEKLKERGRLVITVSQGNTLTSIPRDLTGKSLTDATKMIEFAGLKVGKVTRRNDEQVAKDTVLEVTTDPSKELPKGSTVDLLVSDGPAPRTVPDGLAGLSFEEAQAKLAADQLGAKQNLAFSDTVPEGKVISTNPASGQQAARGYEVVVNVSKGPDVVPVPDVTGRSVDDATAILEGQGFTVDGVVGNPKNPVRRTDPPAGTKVKRGSSVALFTR